MDDDADTLFLLERAAQRCAQFSAVLLARDGQEAFDILMAATESPAAALPDVIVTDLKMPAVNGLELTALVKANPRLKHLPVAILTSSELPEDREAAMRAGCCGFFTKPASVIDYPETFRAILTSCGILPAT